MKKGHLILRGGVSTPNEPPHLRHCLSFKSYTLWITLTFIPAHIFCYILQDNAIIITKFGAGTNWLTGFCIRYKRQWGLLLKNFIIKNLMHRVLKNENLRKTKMVYLSGNPLKRNTPCRKTSRWKDIIVLWPSFSQ